MYKSFRSVHSDISDCCGQRVKVGNPKLRRSPDPQIGLWKCMLHEKLQPLPSFPLWSDLGPGRQPLPLRIRNPSSLRRIDRVLPLERLAASWGGQETAPKVGRASFESLQPRAPPVLQTAAPAARPRRAPDNQPPPEKSEGGRGLCKENLQWDIGVTQHSTMRD